MPSAGTTRVALCLQQPVILNVIDDELVQAPHEASGSSSINVASSSSTSRLSKSNACISVTTGKKFARQLELTEDLL